ncbi:ADP/ATP carrier protein [Exophiala xenobiotica]|nr:ADP/ATP carrier protein [Exophiala xenobiotica]
MSQESELAPWESAVAGAAGAVLANAMVYPLDIVKTRLQVQIKKKNQIIQHSAEHHHYESTLDAIKKIIEHEGLHGLYSGLAGALAGVASTNFAYFYWYSVVRKLYTKYETKPGQHPGTAVELALGAVAGALAQVFTIPVAVITTRQQTQPRGDKKSFWETGKEVVHSDDGWTGLWRGLKASLVLCVNPAITYGAYQRLKDGIYPGRARLRPWEAFRTSHFSPPCYPVANQYLVLGAMSKSLATITTQPLIVAKVGLQSRPPPAREGKPFKTFGEVMAYIIEHEGPLALFKGIGPQLLKGLLVQGLLMMTKERVEVLFVLLFAYLRAAKLRRAKLAAQLKEQAAPVAENLKSRAMPVAESVLEKAKSALPAAVK